MSQRYLFCGVTILKLPMTALKPPPGGTLGATIPDPNLRLRCNTKTHDFCLSASSRHQNSVHGSLCPTVQTGRTEARDITVESASKQKLPEGSVPPRGGPPPHGQLPPSSGFIVRQMRASLDLEHSQTRSHRLWVNSIPQSP